MKQPTAETYEEEMSYIPYKESLKQVTEIICSQTPANGSLLDLMCGPGHLLGKISERREDLYIKGVDLDRDYVDHATKKYSRVGFEVGDILSWAPRHKFDAVMCTGALHHVHYDKQADAVERMSSMVKQDGFVLISDCYIDDYSNETERKIAAAKLGYEYVLAAINNGAPRQIIEALTDILCNDVVMDEFKTSIDKRSPIFNKFFSKVQTHRTWPSESSGYGDYITILRK